MARAKWLSTEEKESIMDMRASGMTAAQIASKMERGVKSIQRVLSAKDDKSQQANTTVGSMPVAVSANAVRKQAPTPAEGFSSYPFIASIMEMHAGGMTPAQIAIKMETMENMEKISIPLRPSDKSTEAVSPAKALPAPHAPQHEFVPPLPASHAPQRGFVSALASSSAQEAAVQGLMPLMEAAQELKSKAASKAIKRPQAPRASVKKTPPKTKASKALHAINAAALQTGEAPRENAVGSPQPSREVHPATNVSPQQYTQPSAGHAPPTGTSMVNGQTLQPQPYASGMSTVEPSRLEDPSTHVPASTPSIPSPVGVGSRYACQQAPIEVSSPPHEVEYMVNVIPDEETGDEDESARSMPRELSSVQQTSSQPSGVRRPPRLNEGAAGFTPRSPESKPPANTSMSHSNSSMGSADAHTSLPPNRGSLLQSFEAELLASQVQTQTPPASQIEPEPCVTKKRKIDAVDVTKPVEHSINHAMALLAKTIDESTASSRCDLAAKRLALLFQRFQADIQLLELEIQSKQGVTTWQF